MRELICQAKKISLSDIKRPFPFALILAGYIRSFGGLDGTEVQGLGEFRAGKPANSPVGAISRRRGYLIRPTPFFILPRFLAQVDSPEASPSIVARRRGAVAAQCRRVRFGGSGAIGM